MTEFTHFDDAQNAHMVDVSLKKDTVRTAVAKGMIRVSADVLDAIKGKKVRKGDVLTVAQVAGIQAVKENAHLIPMCHPIPLTHTALTFETDEEACTITAVCEVKTFGKTGAEMEALTGVSVALLTVYDMCKAIDKRMVIGEIHLLEKHGGMSGDFAF